MSDAVRTVQPFRHRVAEADLDDLRSRLDTARLPERETVGLRSAGRERWSQGVPGEVLRDTVAHWRRQHDWRAFETTLDRIGQFRTAIDGLGIHFLHRRSARIDAVPLLMTHGWPGSIVEFVDVIEELANPLDPAAPAFHVVAPSLPGFGFSDKPTQRGWGTERIAASWVQLMRTVGYQRFLAHGGDWGGVITTILGGRFPQNVIGVHTTLAQAPPGSDLESLGPVDRSWAEETAEFWSRRSAYALQQATRPQTIGYSLVDSPVGLLAWILDKFAEWSDTDDSPFETISMERILDDVTLYWFTRSGASAARIYHESHASMDPSVRVRVPAAVTIYPRDIEKCPRPWAEQRFLDLVRWAEPPRGGHFPSLEVPDDFVADLREGLSAVILAAGRR